MAHEITIREDGFAEAAFSLEPAWHRLGTVFDHVMTGAEGLAAAGLDWPVVQEEVYRCTKREEGFVPQYGEVEGFRLNVRGDNNLVLGMVTDAYKVVQNVEAFQFLDALVENHEMLYESAFSLNGGRKVVLLAKMPGVREVAPGDHLLPYILLSLSHDGSEGIRFGPTSVRVVCANTYRLADAQGGIKELSIRHTGNIKDKLQRARNILSISSQQFAQYAEICQKLAQRRLAFDEWWAYLGIMCPELDRRDPDFTERRAAAIAKTRQAIINCYYNQRQGLAPESAWAAYNAISEHIDHLPRRGATRQRKAECRFNVCLYGIGRDMKQRALETACRFTGIDLTTAS